MMGLFDDVRENLMARLNPYAADWVYSPRFLHTSVVIPCFNMGLVIARKKPFTSEMLEKIKIGKWEGNFAPKVMRQYQSIAMMISGHLLDDVFELLEDMTPEIIKAINL